MVGRRLYARCRGDFFPLDLLSVSHPAVCCLVCFSSGWSSVKNDLTESKVLDCSVDFIGLSKEFSITIGLDK